MQILPFAKAGRTILLICFTYDLKKNGEPDRIRTCDPLIKSQLLYQLSYRPTLGVIRKNCARGQGRNVIISRSTDLVTRSTLV